MKLCKLFSLPDSEMDREPQHAENAEAGKLTYALLQSKIDHDSIIVFGGTPQNPLSFAILIVMLLTKNISNIIATNTPQYYKNTKHESKIDSTDKESIKGFPKGSNPYGDGVPILGNRKGSHLITKVGQRSFSTSTYAVNEKYITGEDLLSKLEIRNDKYHGLYKLICDEDILFGAYHSMKSNPGNMTPGEDGQTLDGIPKKKFKELSESLKTEKFQFKPSKRIFIPKANGKMRPLGIPTPIDKIVQKAMQMTLELIYEPIFSNSSHGFRPQRGCHTALCQISG